MLAELFEQHPLPWSFDDCREGYAGQLVVWDAGGGIVGNLGDMETCTYADIRLAHAIAALSDLLVSLEEMRRAMARYEMDQDEAPPYAHREMMLRADAALDKAGVTGEGK